MPAAVTMRQHLTTSLRGLLRLFGADVVRFPRPPDSSSPAAVRARLLRNLGVTVVLDVGANVGQYAAGLRAAGYAGRIVSFEPLAGSYEQLAGQASRDPLWETRRVALGAEPFRGEINVSANTESSSLMPMADAHAAAAPQSAYVGREQVEVVPLDQVRGELLSGDDRVWLKADVQGYELSVLAGAAATLSQVHAMELELSLVRLYQGAPLVEEVIARARELGFVLVAVEDVFNDPRTGHTLQYAGTFVRHAGAPGA